VRKSPIAGYFIADLHWSEVSPISRSAEESWYLAQRRYMRQLRNLIELRPAPLFIAGDLFDKWNASARTISWALEWLGEIRVKKYAIPGNHDIPHHNFTELDRSAYWTLVEAQTIHHLSPEMVAEDGVLCVHAFPAGFEVKPLTTRGSLPVHVAMIHDYVWVKDHGHPGAALEKRLSGWASKLQGYDVAVFGDNHQGFVARCGNTWVANCGTFMRRHKDEEPLRPVVVAIHQNGLVSRLPLDTQHDKFIDFDAEVANLSNKLKVDLEGFAQELEELHGEKLNYARVVALFCERNKVQESIKTIMLRAVGVQRGQRS
jgi:DNA repair exonuclease SbcCD nuclease subunit